MPNCRILFVCLGNICRSPSAEAVMKRLVEQKGMAERFDIDSAGTGAWHVGERADGRMRSAGRKRDLELTSISRQVRAPEDFDTFDYIVAMDNQNLRDLKKLAAPHPGKAVLLKMTDFCRTHQEDEVPDPYYGGPGGFDQVLDILEDACEGFLQRVEADRESG